MYEDQFMITRLGNVCKALSVTPFCRGILKAHENEIVLCRLAEGEKSKGRNVKMDAKSMSELREHCVDLTFGDGVTFEGFLRNPDVDDEDPDTVLHAWECMNDNDHLDLTDADLAIMILNHKTKIVNEFHPHTFHHIGSCSSSKPVKEWKVVATESFSGKKHYNANRAFGLCKHKHTIVHDHRVRKHADGTYSCSCQTPTRLHLPCSHILFVTNHCESLSDEEFAKAVSPLLRSWTARAMNTELLQLGLSNLNDRSDAAAAQTHHVSKADKCDAVVSEIRSMMEILFSTRGHALADLECAREIVKGMLKTILKTNVVAVSKPGTSRKPAKRKKGASDFKRQTQRKKE